MEIVAFLVTIAAGYLGSALLGANMNWPDAGAIVAVAVMGCFILRELRRRRSHPDKEDPADKQA